MFIKAREVEQTLINGDTSKWSEWSSDNKSKLRRMKSALELKIRRQEFVELIRKGDRLGAVKFARKYFATMDPNMWPSLTPTMGLLAVNEIDTKIEKYRAMFAEDRWKVLVDEFSYKTKASDYGEIVPILKEKSLEEMENLRLFRMTQPPFSALLQAGISSMKTPRCCVQQTHSGVTTRSSALREKNMPSSLTSVDSLSAAATAGGSNTNGRRRRSHTISPASTTTSLPALAEMPSSVATSATSLRASQCPLCQPAARDLVAPLALAHTAQSHLICAYSGEPVNDDNPPVMLPNGMVYGNRSILELASKNNGKIVCPRTKQVFELADIERRMLKGSIKNAILFSRNVLKEVYDDINV
uniref:Macrophage erythroblast attacher n=1 Tax=Romanomermis culicivorax TaxID=13658 RepID=A0A915KX91_ROMCU